MDRQSASRQTGHHHARNADRCGYLARARRVPGEPHVIHAVTRAPSTAPAQPESEHKHEEQGEHEDALKRIWTDPTGPFGWTANVQNGPIVKRFMTTVFAFFLMGGVEALVMRTQLAQPDNTFITPD